VGQDSKVATRKDGHNGKGSVQLDLEVDQLVPSDGQQNSIAVREPIFCDKFRITNS
jgi:hypothetical protein